MKTDRIFVLLLVVMLPLSGCFDGAVGDAEGTEDATSGTTVINNYYNNTTITENLMTENQSKTWYSSGGTFNSQWNMDGVGNSGEYCVALTSNGDHCITSGSLDPNATNPLNLSWNTTECTNQGQGGYTIEYPFGINYAPICFIEFATINTTAGEALMIYEFNEVSVTTSCNGVTDQASLDSDREYNIIAGSAMNCSHTIVTSIGYDQQSSNFVYGDPQPQNPEPKIWSIVYAIQDVTVV